MTVIPRTAATEQAWRQGDTGHLLGLPDSENPYHESQAVHCWRAWDRGWHGYPLDERGGFHDRLPETVEAIALDGAA